MSTSIDPGMSDYWRMLKGENQQLLNGIIEIALKDEFMAADMRLKGSMGDEEEILLPRNSQFRATDIQGLFEQKKQSGADIQFFEPFLVKAQQLNEGGEAGRHYFVSSDSEAFISWKDMNSFMEDIVKSDKNPKINFVAGPSGSGKSFATRNLAMIEDRAKAMRRERLPLSLAEQSLKIWLSFWVLPRKVVVRGTG